MPDTTQLARRLFDAIDHRDIAAIERMLHPDLRYTGPFGVMDRSQMISYIERWFEALADMRQRIFRAVADEVTCALEVEMSGVHVGELATPYGTVPASGAHVVWPMAAILTFRDDLVVEWHSYFFLSELLRQMGAAITVSTRAPSLT